MPLSSSSDRAWHSLSTSTMKRAWKYGQAKTGMGMSQRGALSVSVPWQKGRQHGTRYPDSNTETGNGRKEVGNVKEVKLQWISEMKQDGERWEKQKMNVKRLLVSCMQEILPTETTLLILSTFINPLRWFRRGKENVIFPQQFSN